MIIFVYK